jgi:hypothetical protein
MIPRFVEEVLRERPIVPARREPEIHPVELDVHHDVGVRRDERFQARDLFGKTLHRGQRWRCLLRHGSRHDFPLPSTIGRDARQDAAHDEQGASHPDSLRHVRTIAPRARRVNPISVRRAQNGRKRRDHLRIFGVMPAGRLV